MKTTRGLLTGSVIVLLIGACGGGSGTLTGAELGWCEQYPPLFMAAHDELFGGDAITDHFFATCFDLMSAGDVQGASQLFQERYPDTHDEACRAAYAGR